MPISRSIQERCPDPYATRRRADRGLDVPCPTGCMAFEPGTERGCRIVNRRQPVIREPLVRRGDRGERWEAQPMDLWVLPTPDMMVGPGAGNPPEQENEMHRHVDPELDKDHTADPYDQLLRAGICRKCRKPTREPKEDER